MTLAVNFLKPSLCTKTLHHFLQETKRLGQILGKIDWDLPQELLKKLETGVDRLLVVFNRFG